MAWKTSAKIKSPKRTQRDLWVGFKPNGIGETKPNHYKEMLKTIWDNRDNLPYAWRILNKGVCDGCALGVAGLPRLDPLRRAPVHDPPQPAAREHDGRARPRACSPTWRRCGG